MTLDIREIRHFHLFGAAGGGAKGFNQGSARIGNMVPPAAAEAIAGEMGRTLLLAWSGETFVLDNAPVWVRPIATALSLPGASA